MHSNFIGQVQAAPAPIPIPVASNAPPSGITMGVPVSSKNSDNENDSELNQNTQEIWSTTRANRRTKERKISFVIEKVSMWRKLYNGIQDESGKIVRFR